MTDADLYRTEVGEDAYERQRLEAERGRCGYCWAPPDQPHHPLCPDRPDDEEPAPTVQAEGLF